MENANSLHIITNNNKRVQKKSRLLSIIEYFKDKKATIEFYFYKKHMLKENGKMNSVELFFYSHGTSNSCGVLITFFGKNIICVNTKSTDKHGRVVILDVMIDWSEFILVNIYIVYKHREWTSKCFE